MTIPQYPYIVTPSVQVVATWDSANEGELTAILPGAIFARKLTGVSINCSMPSRADFFYSFVAPQNQFDTTPVGSQNTADYPSPRHIPSNTPVVVRWTANGGIPNGSVAGATFFMSGVN